MVTPSNRASRQRREGVTTRCWAAVNGSYSVVPDVLNIRVFHDYWHRRRATDDLVDAIERFTLVYEQVLGDLGNSFLSKRLPI
jgi:hypothetical protein